MVLDICMCFICITHVSWDSMSEACTCTCKEVKWSRYRPSVPQRVGRGIALLYHDRDSRRGWVVSSTPQPHFTPGKTQYPFYKWLGGPQGWSGWAKNLVSTGIRSWTIQPIVSRYADWATRPTHVHILHKIWVFLSVCFAVRFKRIGQHTGKLFTPWTRGTVSRRANKGCSLYGMQQLHYRWEMRRVHPRSLPWHGGSSCTLPSVCVFFMPYINTLVNFPYCVAFCTHFTFISTFFVQWN